MKKILFIVPLVAMLAAGCHSASTPSGQQSSGGNPPTPSVSPTATPATTGNSWQTTLMASDNKARGQYMITVDGHTIYIFSSRDYSALVGKPVNVHYTGTINSFQLGDITAQ